MGLFQQDCYRELADRHRHTYTTAEPFPHVVIDDFLPAEVCEKVLAEFPDPYGIDWFKFDRDHSKKLATRGVDQFGEATRDLLLQCTEPACLQFLERLTGITGLIPDPYFEGGGLHQIERGGYLKIHTDFNFHTRLRLDRRINLIVYLNKEWRDDYNGHLELWDRGMTRCVRKVLPIYNRCVVFNTTDWSFHGHPERLACPKELTRKSIALYYYTNGRPDNERSEAHGTLWQDRPPPRTARGRCALALRHMASAVESPAKLLLRMATHLG
jgi:hypothetical protein